MRLLTILVTLAALWWLITDGQPSSWMIGFPAVLIATWSYLRLNPRPGYYLSIPGLLRFIPYFLMESLRGGINVASRTLHPRLNIAPEFYRYQTGLTDRVMRVLFVNCVNLLPGTLTADLNDDWLEIHMIDINTNPEAELQRLEEAVRQLFMVRGESA
jgi:multicomponent Na+:H+ antiporter subunit E